MAIIVPAQKKTGLDFSAFPALKLHFDARSAFGDTYLVDEVSGAYLNRTTTSGGMTRQDDGTVDIGGTGAAFLGVDNSADLTVDVNVDCVITLWVGVVGSETSFKLDMGDADLAHGISTVHAAQSYISDGANYWETTGPSVTSGNTCIFGSVYDPAGDYQTFLAEAGDTSVTYITDGAPVGTLTDVTIPMAVNWEIPCRGSDLSCVQLWTFAGGVPANKDDGILHMLNNWVGSNAPRTLYPGWRGLA